MGIDFMSQLEIGSLEALCVQYIESSICQENVLVALDSAARLQLDPLKVQTLIQSRIFYSLKFAMDMFLLN